MVIRLSIWNSNLKVLVCMNNTETLTEDNDVGTAITMVSGQKIYVTETIEEIDDRIMERRNHDFQKAKLI